MKKIGNSGIFLLALVIGLGFAQSASADTIGSPTLSDTVLNVVNTVANLANQNSYYNSCYYNNQLAMNNYYLEQKIERERLLQAEHNELIAEHNERWRHERDLHHFREEQRRY